jgi:hypothetical protein
MRGLGSAIAFVAVVFVIAFGAAGIVAGMDAPLAGGSRPELTDRGDALLTPRLDQAQADVQALADQVDALGVQARGALAALVGQQLGTVEAAIGSGDTLVEDIGARTTALQGTFASMPVVGTPAAGYSLSPEVQARAARLQAALTATDGLADAWSRLTTGSVAATKLSGLLQDHVDAVLKAIKLGRDASYKKAVTAMGPVDDAMAAARTMRDSLSKTVDVSTLDAWLDRTEDYDVALRKLYAALRDSNGRVTKAVRTAITAEEKAKSRLPPDARGLVLIMSDIGRGGMNDAVITIEEARGKLAEALAPPSLDPDASPAP